MRLSWGRDTIVYIAASYGLNSPGFESREGEILFASPNTVKADCGAHPLSYTLVTRGKAAGRLFHHHHHLVSRIRMHGASQSTCLHRMVWVHFTFYTTSLGLVFYSYNKTNEMHLFLRFIFGIELYMFWTGFLSIIRMHDPLNVKFLFY